MKGLLTNHRFVILLDQVVFSGTSFLITLLLARLLSMEDFGKYSGVILVTYLMVSGVGAFVIQPFQVLIYKVKDLQGYATFAFWFQLIAISCIVLLYTGINASFSLGIPLVYVVFVAGFMFHDFGRRLLLAINRPLQTLIFDVTASFFSLLALCVYASSHYNNMDILLAFLTSAYGGSLVLLLAFLRPHSLERANIYTHLSNHIREGKWLFCTAMSQWWAGNLFVVASAVYLGATALGALRLAQSLMGVLGVLLQTLENYILPQMAQKINTFPAEGLAYVASISRKIGLLILPVLAFIFIFSKHILFLAGGAEYIPFDFVLRGMSLLYVLVFLSQPIRLLIRALLLNKHFFYGYLISLLFALVFAHRLLSAYGLKGALVGLAVSQLLLISYWTFILQKRSIYLWKSFISF